MKSIAVLLLRAAVGLVFLYHGYPKLVNSQEWARAFVRMGFPHYFAYIAGAIEFCGGALLILGLAARASSLLLAGEMAVALLLVDLRSGRVAQVENYQLSLLLGAGAFAIAAFGPGAISVDGIVSRRAMRSNSTIA